MILLLKREQWLPVWVGTEGGCRVGGTGRIAAHDLIVVVNNVTFLLGLPALRETCIRVWKIQLISG